MNVLVNELRLHHLGLGLQLLGELLHCVLQGLNLCCAGIRAACKSIGAHLHVTNLVVRLAPVLIKFYIELNKTKPLYFICI